MYQVLNWERHFEGAKSKGYKNKSSCTMPCKHGLGFRLLIREENGPALFGAWCAMIQVLSRQNSPRNGLLTDDGTIHGREYTSEDLEIITGIQSIYFDKLLELCASKRIGWVRFISNNDIAGILHGYRKDTTGDSEGTIVPLNSDSDSNLDSNSNLYLNSNPNAEDAVGMRFPELLETIRSNPTAINAIAAIRASHPAFSKVTEFHISTALGSQPDRTKWADAIGGLAASFAGAEIERPVMALKRWLAGKTPKSGYVSILDD